jgi:hypothetical protein
MQAFHFTKRLCRLIQQIKVICAINVNYFLYCLFLLCFYLPFWIISILWYTLLFLQLLRLLSHFYCMKNEDKGMTSTIGRLRNQVLYVEYKGAHIAKNDHGSFSDRNTSFPATTVSFPLKRTVKDLREHLDRPWFLDFLHQFQKPPWQLPFLTLCAPVWKLDRFLDFFVSWTKLFLMSKKKRLFENVCSA